MKHLGFLRVELLACDFDELQPVAATARVEVSNASVARKTAAAVVRLQRVADAHIAADSEALSGRVQWQQRLDFRCAEGWEVLVHIAITMEDGQELLLRCDRGTVGSNIGGVWYLRQDEAVVGELSLQVDHIPNHQAFSYLAQAISSDQERVMRLLEAVRLTVEEGHQLSSAQTDGMLQALDLAHQYLELFEQPFEQSEDETDSGAGLPIEEVLDAFEQQIAPILKEIESAPKPYIPLLRKQLALFSKHAAPVTEATLPAFLRAALLWYLQHAIVAIRMLQAFDIQLPELVMLRKRFFATDEELAGEIGMESLGDFLQDMGDEYSAKQLELIEAEVDPFGLGIVELPEFVRWWATDSVPADLNV